ncbi:MAG TPA: ABC transporter ATP-binding protein [Clostridia bacterium]|nr:ABC transporter ATP-binding protein [Clostridia bacterium]
MRRLYRLDLRLGPGQQCGVARVAAEQLTKSYGVRGTVRALQAVSFTAEARELLVLVGPSGSGKTTVLRLLAGLEEPDSGTILFNGQNVTAWEPAKRDVAMVFQNPALYPEMTARENIAFGLKVRGCPPSERKERVKETAELLGMADYLDRRPMELSGGQRQRVSLGRALARRPAVLLLDEPFSNLDAPARVQLRAELARIQQASGSTMICVTHDQVEAMTLGHRLVILDQGRVQQIASPLEAYGRPANLFVAGFIGSPPMNLLCGRIVENNDQAGFLPAGVTGTPLPLAPEHVRAVSSWSGKPVVLGIRPEHLAIEDALANTDKSSTVSGMVTFIEATGAETMVRVTFGECTLIVRTPGEFRPRLNERLRVQIPMGRASFFDASTGEAIPCAS